MKKIVGLILLVFIASGCMVFAGKPNKLERDYILSLCYPYPDKTQKWLRDDTQFSGWDRAFNYAKEINVVKSRIEGNTIWSKELHKWVNDTIIVVRGTSHTWSVWNYDIKFNDFYNGYNLKQ